MGVVFEVTKPSATGSDFSAEITTYSFGEVLLVECETKGQHFNRTRQMIARDGVDHFLIQTYVYGFTKHSDAGREAIGSPGKILVIDTSQPWSAITNDFCNCTLVVPRRLLAPQLTHEDAQHARVIDMRNPFCQLILGYINGLLHSVGEMSVQDATEASRVCLGLIAAALNRESAGGSTKTPSLLHLQMLKSSIKRFIDQNLHRPELSIDLICERFNISRTHFYRLFDPEGGIAQYVRARRLDLAYKKFSAPGHEWLSISEVARAVGYSDASAFTRAFRRRFGIAPSDVPHAPSLNLSSLANSSRTWESWFLQL